MTAHTNTVNEKQFWRKVKRHAAALPMARELVAMWYAAQDPATPAAATVAFIGAAAYFVLPLDLIPDLIGPAGFVDDAAVIQAAWLNFSQYVTDAHLAQADAFFAG